VTDIEDIKQFGRNCGGCPYYGTKQTLEKAQGILAPYQYVLSAAILKQVQLVGNKTVIIIDEAHNTIDQIIDCNSYERTREKFEKAKKTLKGLEISLPEHLIEVPTEQEKEKHGEGRLASEANMLKQDIETSLAAIAAVSREMQERFIDGST